MDFEQIKLINDMMLFLSFEKPETYEMCSYILDFFDDIIERSVILPDSIVDVFYTTATQKIIAVEEVLCEDEDDEF